MNLAQYVQTHTVRSDNPKGPRPDLNDSEAQIADVIFFKVAAWNAPSAAELRRLCEQHTPAFNPCRLFDGKGHNFMEIGAWIGDQGLALQLIGLGALLGLWKIMSPRTMLDANMCDTEAVEFAGTGMLGIQVHQ